MLVSGEEVNDEILDTKLIDLMCKHILCLRGGKSSKLLKESFNIGYRCCIWGYKSNETSIKERLGNIKKMEQDNYMPIVRIVACKYEFDSKIYYWADNLHSTIRYLRMAKDYKEVRIRDIPFYMVYVSDTEKKIMQSKYIRDNDEDREGIIKSACKRYNASNSKGLIDVGYTVGDFIIDNPLLIKQ